MKKFSRFWVLLCLTAAAGAASPPPMSSSLQDRSVWLQQSIDRASEQGNYANVQALRMDLAQTLASRGAYPQAARQYELLLAARPSRHERVRLSIELGKMRFATENYHEAISAYEDALHDDPDSWDANLVLARAYARIDLNNRADEAYKRCIHLKPERYEAYQEIGMLYEHRGFLNRATNYFKDALKRSPQANSYLGLADCYVRQGDFAGATSILAEAKTVLPRADYDVRLGEIYRRRGDLARACQSWEDALRRDPDRGDVRLNLALSYDRLHRRAEADQLFKKLLADYPQSPLVHFLHAWVLNTRGQTADALRETRVLTELSVTEGVNHYNDLLVAELKKRS